MLFHICDLQNNYQLNIYLFIFFFISFNKYLYATVNAILYTMQVKYMLNEGNTYGYYFCTTPNLYNMYLSSFFFQQYTLP